MGKVGKVVPGSTRCTAVSNVGVEDVHGECKDSDQQVERPCRRGPALGKVGKVAPLPCGSTRCTTVSNVGVEDVHGECKDSEQQVCGHESLC